MEKEAAQTEAAQNEVAEASEGEAEIEMHKDDNGESAEPQLVAVDAAIIPPEATEEAAVADASTTEIPGASAITSIASVRQGAVASGLHLQYSGNRTTAAAILSGCASVPAAAASTAQTAEESSSASPTAAAAPRRGSSADSAPSSSPPQDLWSPRTENAAAVITGLMAPPAPVIGVPSATLPFSSSLNVCLPILPWISIHTGRSLHMHAR